MLAIRAHVRVPQLRRGTDAANTAERNLAKRLDRARVGGHLAAEHQAELTAMDDASQLVEQPAGDGLMQEVLAFGRSPQENSGNDAASTAERNLSNRLRRARTAGHVTAEHETAVTAMDDAPQLATALTTFCTVQRRLHT
jgi:hypothetical protein